MRGFELRGFELRGFELRGFELRNFEANSGGQFAGVEDLKARLARAGRDFEANRGMGRGVFDGVFDQIAQQHFEVGRRRFDVDFWQNRIETKMARSERRALLGARAFDPEREVEAFARRGVLAHFERVELQQITHERR